MSDPPTLSAPLSFDEACALVVDHLKREIPLAFWSVTQHDGDRQLYRCVRDDAYGTAAGDSHAWSDSFCLPMVTGATPQIAPDAMAVPQYAAAGVGRALPVGAYIGLPLHGPDGVVFGTLCGLDPHRQPESLLDHAPLLELCATLLSQTLHAEHLRLQAIDHEAELRWNAFHDRLTGLPNRAMFLDMVGRALAEDGHPDGTLTVLLIDLDDFKAVNDAFGPAAGDDLLVMVAQRVCSSLWPGDSLARLGGDEFAVLTGAPDSPAVAARIVKALDAPFPIAGTSVEVSASIGATQVSRGHIADDVDDVDALLARADAAMYRAKRAGKAHPVVYESATTATAGPPIRLREALRTAIESGAVEAHYHAIVDLRTERTVGFEALARWCHEGTMIGPDVLVPVAARSGLLPALTERMLDLACAQTAAWSEELGHHHLRIGVNVPPDCVSDPGLPRRVAALLRRHAIKPQQLTLEVTEEALLLDVATAAAVSRQLGDLDVRLSLDDFGTGYSSLVHLQKLSVQAIKTDRGFVHDIDTNPETQRFLRALLNLSRDLGLAIVVEGVERREQADALRRLGCVFAQGHLFGRPSPAADIDLHGSTT